MAEENPQRDPNEPGDERRPRSRLWAILWFALLILGIAAIFTLIDYLFSL